MQFSEMVTLVTDTTKRPDKVSDIKVAINAAIEFFSLAATFSRDLVETTVAIDSTAYEQSFDVTSEFTRFRKLKYIKRTGQRGVMTPVDPQRVFDRNGCEQVDSYYIAGNNCVIKLKDLVATLEVGYYQYPAYITSNSATHWLMTIARTMIHDKAAARVFLSIGDAVEHARYEKMAMQAFEVCKQDFEDSVNHMGRT